MDKQGKMMLFNYFIWIAGNPPRADQSALGAINRPLLAIKELEQA
jgi:hypothetical protein